MATRGKLKLASNIIKTLPRDIVAIYRMSKFKKDLLLHEKSDRNIAKAFDSVVKRDPKKVLIYFEDEKWTARDIQKFSWRVANYFHSIDFKKGDTIALFMGNCSQFSPLWLGINRTGCASALINHNLRLQALKHSFTAVNCKAIIFEKELSRALLDVNDDEDVKRMKKYYITVPGLKSSNDRDEVHNLNQLGAECLETAVKNCPAESVEKLPYVGYWDPCLYIYTSGTTGLPKAATIKTSRLLTYAGIGYHLPGLVPEDRFYTPLPLYHASGALLGSGCMLAYGAAQIVKRAFSATQFWSDCIKYEATAAQYIGELCRYLMAQPPSPNDTLHKVKVMYGNGLRSEIWEEFRSRFHVQDIAEFYGSTEGNCGLANIDNRVGAVGFVPVWYPNFLPITLVKVDSSTGEVVRGMDGLAIPCEANEEGEIVGRIGDKGNRISDFEGYTDKDSTKQKIIEDVVEKGDSWFRSGDILVKDELGYWYFKDRKGDSYRWKGENVSCSEVESILTTAVCQGRGVVVFGVIIPGCEGKAGMAVISDPAGTLNPSSTKFYEEAINSLPNNALPVFVRVTTEELSMTESFKLKRVEYQKTGYNISQIPEKTDRVYVLQNKRYTVLTSDLYKSIVDSNARF